MTQYTVCVKINTTVPASILHYTMQIHHDDGHHRFEILPYLNQYALAYELTEPKEIAHFLSQIAHESRFQATEEVLKYSAMRMKKKFGCKKDEKHYNEATDSCDLGQLRP